MALIAIDVAILPPPSVSNLAVALSAELPAAESQGLRLDTTHLPHVTLTQQFVRISEMTDVTLVIQSVLRGGLAVSLRVTGAGRGSRSVWMQIESSPQLVQLHADLMDALRPYERPGGSASAFAGSDARPEDVRWVSDFRETSSYDRFNPHLTLGHAARLPRVELLEFNADTVALCHLGRFCSCRAVLETWRLPVG